MHLLVNSITFLIGIQLGFGFEISPLIIAGNFGVFDPLIFILIAVLWKRPLSMDQQILLVTMVLLTFLIALSNYLAAIGVFSSGSINPVARIIWYLVFLALLYLLDTRAAFALFYGISIGAMCYAGLSILLYLQNPSMYFGIPYLATEENNANTLGYFMTFGIIAILTSLRNQALGSVQRVTLYLGFLLCGCVGLLTMSKSFWLSLAIILLFVVFAHRGKYFLWIVLPILVLATPFLLPAVEGRLAGSSGSNFQRLSMLSSGLQMAADAPVIGWGHQAYYVLGPLYGTVESDVHNAFIGIALEYGFLAMLLFLFVYFLYPLNKVLTNPKMFGDKYLLLLAIVLGLIWGMVSGLIVSDRLYLTIVTLVPILVFKHREDYVSR